MKQRIDAIKFILRLVEDKTYKTSNYSQEIENFVSRLTIEEVKINILECGVIPELFSHDSTEEKLYSKYTDALLARAFTAMGIESKAIKTRSDSADVEGKTDTYTIVADAKVFRLSRTAKNQKDFKVEALNKWRGTADYACLVAPLYQFPISESQIYRQSVERNVILLSFAHIYFILNQRRPKKYDLTPLWEVTKQLEPTKKATNYWKMVDEILINIFGVREAELEKIKKQELISLQKSAVEEIKFIEQNIAQIKKLSLEEALEALIVAHKFDSRIKQIQKIARLL